MSNFVLFYVDEQIRILKASDIKPKLDPTGISDLRSRYSALLRYIDDYNDYRSRVASYMKEKAPSYQIRIPCETLD